jgi:uncharacterized protein YicC (UPF0701 family)
LGKPNLLGCLEKRDLLNRSAVSVDQLVEWGGIFEEQELINDAIDFYIKAGSSEALEKLLPLAHQEGDIFVYTRLLKALGRQVPAEEWISLGKKAAELGKESCAREAFKKGGVETEQEAEVEVQGEPVP